MREGLDLMKGLVENFWDTLYPEIEDGDLEMRAAPLEWVGSRLDKAVRDCRLTRTGFSWYEYKASRKVPTEEEAGQDSNKAAARQAAIAEGKVPPEDFDKAMDASPKAFYVQLAADFEGALGIASGARRPLHREVSGLRSRHERAEADLGGSAAGSSGFCCIKKREKEPDEPVAGAEPEAAAEEAAPEPVATGDGGAAAAPAKAKRPAGAMTAEPVDRGDAIARVASAAKFLRAESPYDPAPYLMLRGLRWGELRAAGETIDQADAGRRAHRGPPEPQAAGAGIQLDGSSGAGRNSHGHGVRPGLAGPAALRLPRLLRAGQLLRAHSSGRDLRLAGLAGGLSAASGNDPDGRHRDGQRGNARLDQGTGSAAPAGPRRGSPARAPARMGAARPPPSPAPRAAGRIRAGHAGRALRPAAGGHRAADARDGPGAQRDGRASTARRSWRSSASAPDTRPSRSPILEELAAEIERRKLEDWEAAGPARPSAGAAVPLPGQGRRRPEQRQKLYSWICRLDPLQALNVSR